MDLLLKWTRWARVFRSSLRFGSFLIITFSCDEAIGGFADELQMDVGRQTLPLTYIDYGARNPQKDEPY